jgi:hypothetical protein
LHHLSFGRTESGLDARRREMRLRTSGALAALPLTLALVLSGCGGDDGDKDKVASANGGTLSAGPGSGSGGGSVNGGGDQRDKAVKFAECMRKNGVNVPDPDPGSGRMTMKFDGSTPKEKVDKAMQACRQYSPQGDGSTPDPQAEERGRKFAECMRKNGVEKFPDPKPGQRGIIMDRESGEDPDLQSAQQKCQSVLGPGR